MASAYHENAWPPQVCADLPNKVTEFAWTQIPAIRTHLKAQTGTESVSEQYKCKHNEMAQAHDNDMIFQTENEEEDQGIEHIPNNSVVSLIYPNPATSRTSTSPFRVCNLKEKVSKGIFDGKRRSASLQA